MCEFCHQHGEGQKWYLRSENYSDDLLSDLRRQKYIEHFFAQPLDWPSREEEQYKKIKRLPYLIRLIVEPFVVYRRKKTHFGQVVPIEDIDQMYEHVVSSVRLPCICRETFLGSEDKDRYCYGFLMLPDIKKKDPGSDSPVIDESYRAGPNIHEWEVLSKEEAKSSLRDLEKKGLFHSIWTFKTPFIGGICNCDRADCLAMRETVNLGIQTMYRAEYVAKANPELCNGCRNCMRACQFGAIYYSSGPEKVVIDPTMCYGCGVCRVHCNKNAIELKDRSSVPAAVNLW